MRVSTQEQLLQASRAAAAQWRDYLDDTRPAGPDEWVALCTVMAELVRVVSEVEKEIRR